MLVWDTTNAEKKFAIQPSARRLKTAAYKMDDRYIRPLWTGFDE